MKVNVNLTRRAREGGRIYASSRTHNLNRKKSIKKSFVGQEEKMFFYLVLAYYVYEEE